MRGCPVSGGDLDFEGLFKKSRAVFLATPRGFQSRIEVPSHQEGDVRQTAVLPSRLCIVSKATRRSVTQGRVKKECLLRGHIVVWVFVFVLPSGPPS